MYTLLTGNATEQLRLLPAESVDVVFTSPPYYGLRMYEGEQTVQWQDGWTGALGLEPSVTMYVAHLVEIFAAIQRVLRPSGVVWVNLGDSYVSNQSGKATATGFDNGFSCAERMTINKEHQGSMTKRIPGLKSSDLVGVPWTFALTMREAGWYLRRDLIWAKGVSGQKETTQQFVLAMRESGLNEATIANVLGKLDLFVGNCMPESVGSPLWQQHRISIAETTPDWRAAAVADKGTTMYDHFAGNTGLTGEQSQMIDCPSCAKCEPNGGLILRNGAWRPTTSHEYVFMFTKSNTYYCDGEAVKEQAGSGTGTRNLRSVLTLPTRGSTEKHFAQMTLGLATTLLEASVSKKGICSQCGKPWVRVVKRVSGKSAEIEGAKQRARANTQSGDIENTTIGDGTPGYNVTTDWRATCACNAPIQSMTVLDPFSGTATTGIAALMQSADYIGIDTSAAYNQIGSERLASFVKPESNIVKVSDQLSLFGI